MIKTGGILKQFAAWATNFKNNRFLQARLKLTAYYTIAIFILVAIFSLVVYGLFAKNITSNLQYEGKGSEEREAFVEREVIHRALDKLQGVLLVVDGVIIIVIGGIGYYLAGKTLKPVEQAYMRQKKFVADVAHELRTPLAVMKAGSETALSSDSSKAEYKKIIQESLEELDYLSVMVDDLLFLARSDNFQRAELFEFNLSNLTHKQIELMKPYADKKNVILEQDIVDNLFIKGSKAYLKRLIANLVKNAIDYNKPSGKVKVFLKGSRAQVELKVVDTGIGIKKEELKNIFHRFYKADRARSRRSGGAGLGLSIVQEIVKIHRGKVYIKSSISKGTEVSILFKKV